MLLARCLTMKCYSPLYKNVVQLYTLVVFSVEIDLTMYGGKTTIRPHRPNDNNDKNGPIQYRQYERKITQNNNFTRNQHKKSRLSSHMCTCDDTQSVRLVGLISHTYDSFDRNNPKIAVDWIRFGGDTRFTGNHIVFYLYRVLFPCYVCIPQHIQQSQLFSCTFVVGFVVFFLAQLSYLLLYCYWWWWRRR